MGRCHNAQLTAAILLYAACGNDSASAPSTSSPKPEVHAPTQPPAAQAEQAQPASSAAAAAPPAPTTGNPDSGMPDAAAAATQTPSTSDAGMSASAGAAASGAPDAGARDSGPQDGGTIQAAPGEDIPASSTRGDALTEAYAALTHGDRSSLSSIVSAIDAQAEAQPDNPYAVFYAGAFRLWQLSEALDLTAAPGVLENLGRAHELLPDDFRVTGFFGLSQVIIGGFGDAQLLEDGLQTLAKGVEQQSTYGHFLRATAVSTLPATHPAFQTAYGDMAGVGPDCKVNIDAEGVYHYPTGNDPSRSRICTNDGIVPHAWEGYFASFGDIALKSGKSAAEARALYKSAQTAPTYQSWPFKRELEQRIASVDQATASGDVVPWALAGQICVGCHQKD